MSLLLTKLREARGWTRQGLAARAQLSPADVGKYENAVLLPYPSQILRLRDALSYEGDPAELLEEAPDDAL